ncbi:MAG: hypothetical protein KAI81_08160 [Candidatus Marinimicrobia bacterium]|nr:hypothetical protein [Candidatus Neomarinimicrobiota bacterium]
MKKLRLLISVFTILGLSTSIFAQDIEETLKQLFEDNATSYMQPMVTAFGTAMNSGLYKKAKASTGLIPPFGIDVGIVIGLAEVSEDDFYYDFVLPDEMFTISIPGVGTIPGIEIEIPFSDIYETPEAPTIAAPKDEGSPVVTPRSNNDIIESMEANLGPDELKVFNAMKLSGDLDREIDKIPSFTVPVAGLGLKYGLAPMLNANIRIPFGIELSVRGLPEFELPDDLGTFSMYGGGIRKDLPVPILDVTAGAMYQIMKIGDVFSATNINVHAEVGKSLGIPGFKISPYVGAGFDQTNVNLAYTFDPDGIANNGDEQDMDFDFKGENGLRLTAGFSFQIPFLYIHAEVSEGTYKAASVSAGFIFK